MSGEEFQIASLEWAKQEFPKRFKKIAMERHDFTDEDFRGLVSAIHLRLGVSKGTVSRWLGGKMLPSPQRMLEIAEAYNVEPSYLVGNDDAPVDVGLSMGEIDALLPRQKLLSVIQIMKEMQSKYRHPVSDQWFAEASVRLMEMVADNPDMSLAEIKGNAHDLLSSDPSGQSAANGN